MRVVFKYIITLLYIARVAPYTHHPFGGMSYARQKIFFLPSRETVTLVTPFNEESDFNTRFGFDTVMSDFKIMENSNVPLRPLELFVPAHNVNPSYSEKQFMEYLKYQDKEYEEQQKMY